MKSHIDMITNESKLDFAGARKDWCYGIPVLVIENESHHSELL
jgi:hypothetical protein